MKILFSTIILIFFIQSVVLAKAIAKKNNFNNSINKKTQLQPKDQYSTINVTGLYTLQNH